MRTSCPSAVAGVYDRKAVCQRVPERGHYSDLLVGVAGERWAAAQRAGRRVRGGNGLVWSEVPAMIYRKTTT